MSELLGGRDDLQVLQAVAGTAEECALELAQDILSRFVAVLVDRVQPEAGDPGLKVRIRLDGGAGSGRVPFGAALTTGRTGCPTGGRTRAEHRTDSHESSLRAG
ncbi:hypothetical protein [Arthrobacter sp. UYEF3]|uniref:hypothetical protein n=1 Tax=Arthrobacter sp. UYEF3 TaxID=1756365 RepID=UPI003396F9F3